MTDLDREQLRRDCSDALEAHLRNQLVDGLVRGGQVPRNAQA